MFNWGCLSTWGPCLVGLCGKAGPGAPKGALTSAPRKGGCKVEDFGREWLKQFIQLQLCHSGITFFIFKGT